jgi:hypothetical protein
MTRRRLWTLTTGACVAAVGLTGAIAAGDRAELTLASLTRAGAGVYHAAWTALLPIMSSVAALVPPSWQEWLPHAALGALSLMLFRMTARRRARPAVDVRGLARAGSGEGISCSSATPSRW